MPPTAGGERWPARVLVVSRWYPSHDAPGRGSFVADHVAALVARGIDVRVASWDVVGQRDVDPASPVAASAIAAWTGPVAEPTATGSGSAWGVPGVPVARLPIVTPGGDLPATAETAAHAALLVPYGIALAARWPFDLIHAHVGIPDGAAALELADRMGTPLVVTEHSSATPGQLATAEARAVYARLQGPGRGVSAVGRTLATTIEDLLGWSAGAMPVLPNPVAFRDFAAGDQAGRDRDELLWVGARRESKGMALLLEAVAEARRTVPGLRLRMIGEAPDAATERRWRSLAEDLGIAGSVAFEPQTDRAGVAAAMRRAGIFVHPSPRETFGMVAAEALASGLPVACRRSGGVEEITAGAGPGVEFADPDTATGLAAAIVRLRNRLDDVDEVSLRASVVERYEPDRVIGALLDWARTVAATMPGRSAGGATVDAAGAAASGGAAPATPGPIAGPVPDRVVVVGLRRPWAARRVGVLPAALAKRITVITDTGGPHASGPLPAAGRWIEVDPDREYRRRLDRLGGIPDPRRGLARRAATALLHPARARARRRLLEERPALRLATTRDGVLRSLGDPDLWRATLLVALDAEDVQAAAPALAAGAVLAPGSLRWLADAWSAGHLDA